MAGQLAEYGYQITEDREKADLWLLNSCTVKGPSEAHFVTAIKTAKEKGKFVVVSGCVPQAQKKMAEIDGLSVIGVQQIDRVVEVVEETLKGHTVRLFSAARKTYTDEEGRARKRKAGGSKLDLPKIRKNPLVEIVPINTGCLNACTYCKTKHARGDLGSYSLDEIVERIVQVTSTEGVKEIWLTSEDLGAYGKDIGTNIAELLDRIVAVLPEGVMLRAGMTNPPYIMEHLESIARILNHPRVYSFLHVPVQAASDSVLEAMKRTYTCAEFRRVVDFLRAKVPGVQIATDIICGFPTETAADFDQTLALCAEYKFSKLHISQFYPRPGTPAMRMQKLDTKIVKSRSRALTKVFNSYTSYDDRPGTFCNVLITEVERHKLDPKSLDPVSASLQSHSHSGQSQVVPHWVGHNKAYEPVTIPRLSSHPDLLGRIVEVEVLSSGKFHQAARISNLHPAPCITMPGDRRGRSNQLAKELTGTKYREIQRAIDDARGNPSKVPEIEETIVGRINGVNVHISDVNNYEIVSVYETVKSAVLLITLAPLRCIGIVFSFCFAYVLCRIALIGLDIEKNARQSVRKTGFWGGIRTAGSMAADGYLPISVCWSIRRILHGISSYSHRWKT
eukprot:671181_1